MTRGAGARSPHDRAGSAVRVPPRRRSGRSPKPAERPGRPGAAAQPSLARRSRSAFPITVTLEKLIAALAIMGLRSTPNQG